MVTNIHCTERALRLPPKMPSHSSLLRFLPPLVVELGWWTFVLLDPAARLGQFAAPTPYLGRYWYMTVTMVFGSLVAGATSEGGGAVAFPVMTLALGVPPPVARDFSFAIQSFGMTCASIVILGLGVPIDSEAVLWGSLGGGVGLAAGLVGVAPHLPAAYAKMLFVSTWMAFAVALFRLNRSSGERRVYESAKERDEEEKGTMALTSSSLSLEDSDNVDAGDESICEDPWEENEGVSTMESEEGTNNTLSIAKRKRAAALVLTGIFGGICSAVAGSGLDMASFSVLTLYYRVSEKVATPTSVVLMAANAVLGTALRTLFRLGGDPGPGEAKAVLSFVLVCVPVVVIGAPLGATVSARFLSRRDISRLLCILDVVQFVAAVAVVRPWMATPPHNFGLCLSSAGTLFVGSVFFFKLASWGEHRAGAVTSSTKVKLSSAQG